VIDDRRNDIQVFDAQGKVLRQIGTVGTGDGQLADTGYMTVGPDGSIYVADYGNDRVEVFGPDGAFARKWPAPRGTADLALDANGNVFAVNDSGALMEFDPAGKRLLTDNTLGLNEPLGILLDPAGLIYVADQFNNRILVLRQK
jgi:DNA-binding beta-propeller fold protein YncE